MIERSSAPPSRDSEPRGELYSETAGRLSACPVSVNARRSPDAPAIVGFDTVLSWADLDRKIEERNRLRTGAPDVLAVRATHSADLVAELFAAARRGRAIVLVSPRLPAGPAERFVREAGAEWADPDPEDTGARDGRLSAGKSPATVPTAEPEPTGSATIRRPDAPLTYMQTSGSSDLPRTIVHSWRNHAVSAARVVDALNLTPQDRWLWSLPPHHVGGLSIVFRCAVAGAAIILPAAKPSGRAQDSDNPHSDGKWTLRSAILDTASTLVSCVPLQLRRMIDAGQCPPSVRDVVVGGAPIDAGLIEAAIAAGYPVRTTYGCTESASMMTLSRPFESVPLTVHAGRALRPDTVAVDADGSIRLRGETLAVGRVVNGGIRSILDADGWYRSGDRGHLEDDGRLVVGGRADDVFVSGGENISARTVERALLEMDGVRSVIVVPVPSRSYGQRPVAFIDSDAPCPDLALVRKHLADRLPGFMHPDMVIPLGPPPEGYLKWPRRLLIERATAARQRAE